MAGYSFLSCGIGRGHPFYLDGVQEALQSQGAAERIVDRTDVFSASRGLFRSGWFAARAAYKLGASGGLVGSLYNQFRNSSKIDPNSLMVRMLRRSLLPWLRRQGNATVVVDHPILLAAIGREHRTIYQHGELVAPDESLVPGGATVIVPTDAVANRFEARGYKPEEIFVSGCCVEPPLVALNPRRRVESNRRLQGKAQLLAAVFSSGAEPDQHLAAIDSLLRSTHPAVRLALVATQQGRLHRLCKRHGLAEHAEPSKNQTDSFVVPYAGRDSLNSLTASWFDQFDLFVAPTHERVNWSMALGLPIVPLLPAIGSFAPLNYELVEQAGLTVSPDLLREATPESTLRSAIAAALLAGEATSLPADGFAKIASWLVSN